MVVHTWLQPAQFKLLSGAHLPLQQNELLPHSESVQHVAHRPPQFF